MHEGRKERQTQTLILHLTLNRRRGLDVSHILTTHVCVYSDRSKCFEGIEHWKNELKTTEKKTFLNPINGRSNDFDTLRNKQNITNGQDSQLKREKNPKHSTLQLPEGT